jgi:hypothetical protein
MCNKKPTKIDLLFLLLNCKFDHSLKFNKHIYENIHKIYIKYTYFVIKPTLKNMV